MLREYPDILNFTDFKEVLGIGKNKAYELLASKAIEHFRIGTNYKIPKKSVLNYIQNEIDKNNLT